MEQKIIEKHIELMFEKFFEEISQKYVLIEKKEYAAMIERLNNISNILKE